MKRSLNAHEVPLTTFERALEETRASVTPEASAQFAQMEGTLKQEGPRTKRIGFDT